MRILYSFLIFFFINLSVLWASPVTKLRIFYKEGHLFLESEHPSSRLDRHYIKKVKVIRNVKDAREFYFTRQQKLSGFDAVLAVEVLPGDVLDVELYCSQGGISKERLEFPLK